MYINLYRIIYSVRVFANINIFSNYIYLTGYVFASQLGTAFTYGFPLGMAILKETPDNGVCT